MFKRGFHDRIHARTENDRARRAKRFCQPKRFPRCRLDLALEVVNVLKDFHSTFSARILSASLSAISAGLSPVMISTAVSRTGGFMSSVRLTIASGALAPKSSSDHTGMFAFDAFRMPMN